MKVDRFGKRVAAFIGFLFYTLTIMAWGVFMTKIRLNDPIAISQWTAMIFCIGTTLLCAGLAFLTEEG